MIKVEYEAVRLFLLPAILEHFSTSGSEMYEDLDIDISKFDAAAAQVTANVLALYRCFNGVQYLDKWASVFNYAFIHFANQQTAINYEQINLKYNEAVDFFKNLRCTNRTNLGSVLTIICSSVSKKKNIDFF